MFRSTTSATYQTGPHQPAGTYDLAINSNDWTTTSHPTRITRSPPTDPATAPATPVAPAPVRLGGSGIGGPDPYCTLLHNRLNRSAQLLSRGGRTRAEIFALPRVRPFGRSLTR